MGLFSGKKKTDPAAQASQQASQAIMNQMANTKLPALPVIPQAATPQVNVPTSLPSYLGGGAGTVYPAGMPNQLSMIANQLSAGGYGTPQAISNQLSGIYHPQTVAPTPPPVPVAPAAPAAPAASAAPAAPAAAPVVQKPMGFTAASQPKPSTSSTLYGGPMFNNFSDFLSYLQNIPGSSNINRR